MAKFVYSIDKGKCIVCGTCELECSFGAIFLDSDIRFAVDASKCRGCGACAAICPVDAITKSEKSGGKDDN